MANYGPYNRDWRGRFDNGSGYDRSKGRDISYGRGRPRGKGRQPIQRWSKEELEAARKTPDAVQKEMDRIAELKKKGLTPDSATPVPMGKSIQLIHRTTPEAADSIVKHGFTPPSRRTHGTNTMYPDLMDANYMYGVVPKGAPAWKLYGKAAVSVTVPRKLTQIDKSMDTFYPPPRRVLYSDLKGRKVTRTQ